MSCLPADIPKNFIVDINDLHIGMSIKVSNMNFDENIEVISGENIVICAVTGREIEEVEEEEEIE